MTYGIWRSISSLSTGV